MQLNIVSVAVKTNALIAQVDMLRNTTAKDAHDVYIRAAGLDCVARMLQEIFLHEDDLNIGRCTLLSGVFGESYVLFSSAQLDALKLLTNDSDVETKLKGAIDDVMKEAGIFQFLDELEYKSWSMFKTGDRTDIVLAHVPSLMSD